MTPSELVRLTSLSHGAGCACKLSLDELQEVLRTLPPQDHPDLLVGHQTGDDAAVWRRDDGHSLVATTDFFTPIVDDAWDWGRIAAANAVSDVYAMGAEPLFALNIVGWPRSLPFDLLRDVLAGAAQIAAGAGYMVAGGHTIDSREPFFGQAIVGDLSGHAPLTNAGASPGDALLLTKPIGTGIVTTAVKRSERQAHLDNGPLAPAYRAAVTSMTTLNASAASVARTATATAVTDVTGFGLLGHAHRLALASGVALRIAASAVPLLPDVIALRDVGHVPGGTQRNADQAATYLDSDVDPATILLLADAQTSGGLLIACPSEKAAAALESLLDSAHAAAIVGTVVEGTAGSVLVDP